MQQCFLSFHHQENETMFVIFVMFFKFHWYVISSYNASNLHKNMNWQNLRLKNLI